MYLRLHILLVATLSCLPLHLPAAEKVQIRQHWEAGRVYTQEVVTSTQATNAGSTQESSITQLFTTTVRKEPAGDKTLAEVKLASLKAIVKTPTGAMTYDSADPALSKPFLQQVFGALLGKSVILVHDKDDKFLEMRVPEGEGSTPLGDFKGPDHRQFAEALRQSILVSLPSQSLAPGDAYQYESRAEMPPVGAMVARVKGRLAAIQELEGRKHAKLTLEGTIEIPGGGQQPLAPSQGTVSGEILFDVQRKVVSRSSVRNEIKLRSAKGSESAVTVTTNVMLKSVEEAK